MGTTKVRKPRAATFSVGKVKGVAHFTPVNRYAKVFALGAGSKTLTVSGLKPLKKAGYRILETGSLKTIKV